MTPMRRNYITVIVPRDLSSDPDERFDIAISEAKERMKTYVVPALWRVVWDQGEYIRLCRESYGHNTRLDTGQPLGLPAIEHIDLSSPAWDILAQALTPEAQS